MTISKKDIRITKNGTEYANLVLFGYWFKV